MKTCLWKSKASSLQPASRATFHEKQPQREAAWRRSMGSEGEDPSDRKSSPFKEGAEVRVRSEDGGTKEFLVATIVRQHRNGDFTVKYEATGEVEKNVSKDRVKAAERSEAGAAFEVGDAVLFQEPGKDGGSSKWREGSVRLCRKDGLLDIVDSDSKEVVKKVPETLVKLKDQAKTRKSRRQEGDGSDGSADDKKGTKLTTLEVDTEVQFKNQKGDWCAGRVRKVRSNGTYDVALESDEDDVSTNVERGDIRDRDNSRTTSRRKKPKPQDDSNDESDDDRERRALRKQKSQPRGNKSKRELAASDDDDDSDDDRRRPQIRNGATRLVQLQVNQVVDFEDKNGRIRRGRIKVLRKEQRNCDIEHENDVGKVSKRVPLDVIRPTTAFNRLFGGMNGNPVPFQLNTHVFYRSKDGVERKGIVLKVSRNDGKTLYDVEDLQDGTLLKQLSAGKLRAVPWLNYSLPSWNGLPSFPSFSLFSSPILRQGVKVRFRRRHKETGRITWKEGVIVKAKANACCVVEYFGSDGETEREQIKNCDIQARFLPFSGMLDGMLDGLTLPSIQLPTSTYKVGSSVEVSSGAKVFLGTVISSNDQEKTYTIKYNDGRKEKNVPSDRVRLSLRRLRIGTEVEMIVEGPCKEVSKLDGEVAWIHRDEKVAVRINGGNNDVFAEVCTHALMVDGKPAFTAPLSSTWLELMGYYCNLAAEVLIYLWFFFGMVVEMDEMLRLHGDTAPALLQDPEHMIAMYSSQQVDWGLCRHSALHNDSSAGSSSYLLIDTDVMTTDRAWLVALLTTKAEYQRERVIRRHLALVMGSTLVVSFLTLINYASLLNRFDFYCLLDGTTSFSFDKLALSIDPFATNSKYTTTMQLLVALAAKTTFNLFRGVAFHLLLSAFPTSGTDFLRRILFLVPSIAVTTVLCAVGGAALHVFYFVQKSEMLGDDALTLTTQSNLAVLLVVLSLGFNRSVYRLVATAGNFMGTQMERQWTSRGDVADDVLDLAERGEFGLQAQREALVTKVEQRQEQLGVCKLSILRIHRHVLAHLAASVIAICIDVTLRHVVTKQQDVLTSAESDVALRALGFHLGFSITWLIGSVLAAMYAVALRQQSPELLAYILDV
ncbi:hypothetical protein BBJ28_00003574 [Nothophytophthora sp. Chile5]|nr:hypothetical protein BBJ28_00003574 [Nothophytophthora sp. Chile5]